jgi:hypothetical protein
MLATSLEKLGYEIASFGYSTTHEDSTMGFFEIQPAANSEK